MTKTPAKTATKSAADKPAAAKKPAGGGAFNAPLKPSPELGAVIGDAPLPRTEAVSKIWAYIKKNKLQDSVNRRMINADDKLKVLFGKAQASMFELTKFVSKHLK